MKANILAICLIGLACGAYSQSQLTQLPNELIGGWNKGPANNAIETRKKSTGTYQMTPDGIYIEATKGDYLGKISDQGGLWFITKITGKFPEFILTLKPYEDGGEYISGKVKVNFTDKDTIIFTKLEDVRWFKTGTVFWRAKKK